MQFKDIIGQEEIKNQLRLSVREGRIPHAQLFSGITGIGKLQLAVAYAQYIACPNHTDEDSCGCCPSCLQYQKLQHPDLHFVFPIAKSEQVEVCDDVIDKFREMLLNEPYFDLNEWYAAMGAETKQGLIYEKESSEILRKLSLKSFSDGYKVMIIWQPEKMHVNCSNKLLKLLEEPPEKTLFLLVSDEPEQILSTIFSRAQQIRIPRLSEDEIAGALIAHLSLSWQQAQDIAHIANGSYLRAIQYAAENEQNEQNFNDFVSLMRNAWLVGVRKNYDALQALRKWSIEISDAKVGRERQKNFLQYVQRQIRENYIHNLSAPEMNYQTTAEREFSSKFAPFINERNVEQIMNELDKAEQQIAQNGNAKIIFFDLCLQMIVLIKK